MASRRLACSMYSSRVKTAPSRNSRELCCIHRRIMALVTAHSYAEAFCQTSATAKPCTLGHRRSIANHLYVSPRGIASCQPLQASHNSDCLVASHNLLFQLGTPPPPPSLPPALDAVGCGLKGIIGAFTHGCPALLVLSVGQAASRQLWLNGGQSFD